MAAETGYRRHGGIPDRDKKKRGSSEDLARGGFLRRKLFIFIPLNVSHTSKYAETIYYMLGSLPK
jgi:hypothetical protein